MAEPPKPMFIETATVDWVLDLQEGRDPETQEYFLLLTIHLEDGKTVRLPMRVEIAMRIWALFDKFRIEKGWPEPEKRPLKPAKRIEHDNAPCLEQDYSSAGSSVQ